MPPMTESCCPSTHTHQVSKQGWNHQTITLISIGTGKQSSHFSWEFLLRTQKPAIEKKSTKFFIYKPTRIENLLQNSNLWQQRLFFFLPTFLFVFFFTVQSSHNTRTLQIFFVLGVFCQFSGGGLETSHSRFPWSLKHLKTYRAQLTNERYNPITQSFQLSW